MKLFNKRTLEAITKHLVFYGSNMIPRPLPTQIINTPV